jgi:4-hydroxyphenylacetaldehyde oxime monooxygenase
MYQVDKLLCNLRSVGPKMPVALNDHIFGLADGIIGAVAFGNIYGTERFTRKERFQHVLDEAMDMMASFSAEDFFPNAAGHLVDRLTGLVARRERIFRELDAFFEMVIDQHMDPNSTIMAAATSSTSSSTCGRSTAARYGSPGNT